MNNSQDRGKISKEGNIKMDKKLSNWAIEKAVGAWTTEKTSHKVMDEELAFEFAKIIERIGSRPWLGNATTKELLEELTARAEVGGYSSYKTVDKI